MTGMDDLVTWLRPILINQRDEAQNLIDSGAGIEAAEFWRNDAVAKLRMLDLTDFDVIGGYDDACEAVFKLLAVVYADRPGYQQQWRPA